MNKNKKNTNRLTIILFLLFISVSLNAFSQEKTLRRPITPVRSIEECRKLILEKGDTIAYRDLFTAISRENRYGDYIFYSLYMIEKYNYVGAYYWVYMSTVFFYRVNKIPLDGQVLKIALEYLEKGAELGSSGAQIELGELYLKGKYVVQDTIKGKELYAKGWGIPVEKLNPFWR